MADRRTPSASAVRTGSLWLCSVLLWSSPCLVDSLDKVDLASGSFELNEMFCCTLNLTLWPHAKRWRCSGETYLRLSMFGILLALLIVQSRVSRIMQMFMCFVDFTHVFGFMGFAIFMVFAFLEKT